MKDKKHEGRKVLKPEGTTRKKDALASSNRAPAARGKPGVIGNPFKKGEDPRRHKLGRVSLDRAAFAAQLNNYFCNGIGDPRKLADVLWKCALKGQAWAVCELLDRICGKEAQPIRFIEPAQRYRVVYADGTPASRPFYGPGFIDPADEKLALSLIDEKAEGVLALSRKTEDPDGR